MKIYCEKINKNHLSIFEKKVKKIIFDSKFLTLKSYVQHGETTTYKHLVNVAYVSFLMAEKLKLSVDFDNLVVGALLHDYVFYDWHIHGDIFHGFKHPSIAMKNATNDFKVNAKVRYIIRKHMWPLTFYDFPNSIECLIVCIADKLCSISETFKNNKVGKKYV